MYINTWHFGIFAYCYKHFLFFHLFATEQNENSFFNSLSSTLNNSAVCVNLSFVTNITTCSVFVLLLIGFVTDSLLKQSGFVGLIGGETMDESPYSSTVKTNTISSITYFYQDEVGGVKIKYFLIKISE